LRALSGPKFEQNTWGRESKGEPGEGKNGTDLWSLRATHRDEVTEATGLSCRRSTSSIRGEIRTRTPDNFPKRDEHAEGGKREKVGGCGRLHPPEKKWGRERA